MNADEFEALAHRLAEAAAAETLPRFRATLDVEDKGEAGFDPVTLADRAAEQAMRRIIADERPDDGILGEEFPETEGRRWRWVLDPIDGTRSFISGIPLWTTIIGLEADARPAFGMVDQPYVGDRFWGDGSRAFMRDRFGQTRALRTRSCGSLGEATLMTTAPSMIPDAADRARYDRVEARARLARYGADGYAYMALAAGQIDLVVEAGLQPYDVVGLVPIVEGAGGIVTGWDGGMPGRSSAVVACGDRALHAQIVELLAGREG